MQIHPTKLQLKRLLRILFYVMLRLGEEVVSLVKHSLPKSFEKNGFAVVHGRMAVDLIERKYVWFRNLKSNSDNTLVSRICYEHQRRKAPTCFSRIPLTILKVSIQAEWHKLMELTKLILAERRCILQVQYIYKGPLLRERRVRNIDNVLAVLFILGNAHTMVINGSGWLGPLSIWEYSTIFTSTIIFSSVID